MAEIRNLWKTGMDCVEIARETGYSVVYVIECVDTLERHI